jgi:membrane protein YqaA with SNARE-associated domain
MKAVVQGLYRFFAQMGGFGLLGLGALDSSILFMPMGNDLLLVALVAREPGRWPVYVLLATAGSVLGCLLTDAISRKGGQAGLERRLPKRRLEYLKRKVDDHAAKALALAAVMPPPFPFTPVVVTAAALQYPRKKLLGVLSAGRAVRFTGEALLAVFFGRSILRMAEHPIVQTVVLAVLAISIVGSTISIASWVRRSRKYAATGQPQASHRPGSQRSPHAV